MGATLPAGLERHPWNDGFEPPEPPASPRRLTAAEAEQFCREGFVLLRGVFERELIEEVVAATDELEQAREAELEALGGRRGISEKGAITFSAHLVLESPLLRAFTARRELAEICGDLIGPDANLYWDQAVYKMPEKPRRFPWHQDNGYTFVVPQHYLTCWTPLVEVTIENGCPQVVPGAHLHGTLRHRYVEPLGWECFADPPSPPVAVSASPGDVVAFSSLTPHMTGPNLSGAVRKAYIVQFAPAGAEILRGDPESGPPSRRESCDDPGRQFPVLRSGQPVLG